MPATSMPLRSHRRMRAEHLEVERDTSLALTSDCARFEKPFRPTTYEPSSTSRRDHDAESRRDLLAAQACRHAQRPLSWS